MTTLNVTLPDSIQQFVEEQTAKRAHQTVEECLLDLLREAQQREARKRVDGLLLEALESGPSVPLTKQDWEELHAEVDRIEQAKSS